MRIEAPKTLERFRSPGPCDLCGARCNAREPHHVMARGRGDAWRNDLSINILGLCVLCHNKAHGGTISREQQVKALAAREGTDFETHWNLLQRIRHL